MSAPHSLSSVPLRRQFRMFFSVIVVVVALSVVKYAIHLYGFEFLTLNALFSSAIAAAVFIIGFLLSSVLSDYKEAERIPADLRVALEAIRDDATSFAEANPSFSARPTLKVLHGIVTSLRESLDHSNGARDLRPAIAQVAQLRSCFLAMERAGMPPNYVVRLRGEQNTLRRTLFRIYHIEKIKFVPSVHVLVQTLVAAVIILLLLLETEGSPASALIFGAISYMFIYALNLIDTLEHPYRKGTQSLDDVSLFLLNEFESAVRCELAETPESGAAAHENAGPGDFAAAAVASSAKSPQSAS